VTNWVFAQTTYIVTSRCSFARWMAFVVLSFKFDQNRLSGYRDFRDQIWVPAILWSVVYTALYYCTGVIKFDSSNFSNSRDTLGISAINRCIKFKVSMFTH